MVYDDNYNDQEIANSISSYADMPGMEIKKALIEDLLDGREQSWSGTQWDLTPRRPERKINRSLIAGTTQSFADAFSLAMGSKSGEAKGSLREGASAPTAKGIATYEAIARVIYDETMPRGGSLNLNA